MQGLGDVIEWATKKLGIQPCPACKGRQEYLNALIPFKPQGARMQTDGVMVFPIRGLPPKVPEGYTRSMNPFVLKIKLEPCLHRAYVQQESGCCGTIEHMTCSKYSQKTDNLNCKNCQAHGGDK